MARQGQITNQGLDRFDCCINQSRAETLEKRLMPRARCVKAERTIRVVRTAFPQSALHKKPADCSTGCCLIVPSRRPSHRNRRRMLRQQPIDGFWAVTALRTDRHAVTTPRPK
jgi:hypothetical protein